MPQRFRVALSFPSEHRKVVEAVAYQLVEKLGEGTVFYDKYFEYVLARPNLDDYLQKIYHDNADLVVIFLCADYEKKEWCGVELRAIKDLIKKGKDDMIMPLRIDDEEVRGFLSIDGALYLDNRPPTEIAELIVKRLNSLRPPLPSPRNRLPSRYRGLEAFRMEDERFFFGRKMMIRLLFDKIHLVETLAVVGASGVGKSSLIQAGLLPKLRDQGWLILPARLSDAPFLNLGLAMAENLNEPAAALAATYEASPTRLLEDLRKVGHPDKYVVLYIDQFEELFTLSGQNAQGRLLDALFSRSGTSAKWASERLRIVVSFRSEFQDLAMRHPSLRAMLEKCGTQPVGEMSEDEVRDSPGGFATCSRPHLGGARALGGPSRVGSYRAAPFGADVSASEGPARDLPAASARVPNPNANVAEILMTVADRFSLEITFRDCKEVVGAGQQQVRFVWANIGAFHICLWTFTMTEAWAWARGEDQLVDRRESPWDDPNRRPSHADKPRELLADEIRGVLCPGVTEEEIRAVAERLLALVA